MPAPPSINASTAAELAAAIAWRCEGATQTSTGWDVRCPTHDDHTPSLSIDYAPDKALLICRAHCPTAGILSALGLTWSDLFLQPRGSLRKLGTITALYDYVDASGVLKHQTVRFVGEDGVKKFRQRRPDPTAKDGWVWRIKDIPHVLYHLPAVLQATQRGEPVYLVEGEKDADNLQALGITATTNAMGSGSWEVQYNETLRGAHLVMLPDYDEAGQQHMLAVAARLHGLCASIKLVPGIHTATAKSDVSDWLAAGGTRAQLEAVVEGTALWSPPTLTAQAPTATNGTHAPTPPTHFDADRLYTDTYNARALVRDHGANLRYCYPWKAWLVWTGTHWQRDTSGVVMRLAKQTVKAMAGLLPSLDDKQAFALLAHIKASLTTAKLKAMLENAQSEEGMAVQPDEFDRDLFLLNVANGTIDLRTGTLRETTRSDLLTKCLTIAYDPTATCPRWEAFVTRAMGGKQGLVAFLHRAVGYSLTGSTIEQCLFILHGPTKTGKTTFLARLRSLLGPYGTQADMESFMHKDRPEVRNDLADLAGRRVVCAVESQEGRRLNESLIKQLTGGVDQVKARFLFEEYFTYTPQYKIFIGTNHKPVIKDTNQAIWERIRLVPFIVQIPPKERDKKLDDALQAELPGILAWAVRGCLDWQQRGDLEPPPEVLNATKEWQDESDVIGRFLAERCVMLRQAQVRAQPLWDAYKAWCETNGETWEKQTAFGIKLGERGFEKKQSHGIVYMGLGLRSDDQD
jgi:putative DNA primase/helicase